MSDRARFWRSRVQSGSTGQTKGGFKRAAQICSRRFSRLRLSGVSTSSSSGWLSSSPQRTSDWPAAHALGFAVSWARGEGRLDSDTDILLLTDRPERFTQSDEWLHGIGDPPVIRREQFGVINERRVRLPSGLKVEFGTRKRKRYGCPIQGTQDPRWRGCSRCGDEELVEPVDEAWRRSDEVPGTGRAAS
jgi:hypothetical protein